MKRALMCLAVALLFAGTLGGFALPDGAAAAETKAAAFERYRAAIQSAYDIDIKDFKDSIPGGRADGRSITDFDLNQLLMGIKVELEHTDNKMKALEISMDHLEEFPDYYTRLLKMEEEAEREFNAKASKK